MTNVELFKQLVADYKPSDEVLELAQQSNLLMFAGVTSSGRNTIIKNLVDRGGYRFIISDTTREPRINNGVPEKDGVSYNFKTENEMIQRIKDQKLLEVAIIHKQQVSGIGIEELKKTANKHEIGLTDIESEGTANVLRLVPEAKAVFIIPPTFDEWIKRITARGGMDQEEIRRRLETAEHEIEDALKRDDFKIFVNDNFKETADEIHNFAKIGTYPTMKEQAVKNIAWQLLNDLKSELNS